MTAPGIDQGAKKYTTPVGVAYLGPFDSNSLRSAEEPLSCPYIVSAQGNPAQRANVPAARKELPAVNTASLSDSTPDNNLSLPNASPLGVALDYSDAIVLGSSSDEQEEINLGSSSDSDDSTSYDKTADEEQDPVDSLPSRTAINVIAPRYGGFMGTKRYCPSFDCLPREVAANVIVPRNDGFMGTR